VDFEADRLCMRADLLRREQEKTAKLERTTARMAATAAAGESAALAAGGHTRLLLCTA